MSFHNTTENPVPRAQPPQPQHNETPRLPEGTAKNILSNFCKAADLERVALMNTPPEKLETERALYLAKAKEFEKTYVGPLQAIGQVLHNHKTALELPAGSTLPDVALFEAFSQGQRDLLNLTEQDETALRFEFDRVSGLMADFGDWRRKHKLLDS